MSETPTQERDRIPSRRLAILAACALGVGGAGVVLSTVLGLPFHPHEPGPPPVAAPQIGIVEQSLIESTERGVTLRRGQTRELECYGFVDQQHQVAGIPIDRAMHIVAEKHR